MSITPELATLLAVVARISAWAYTAPLIGGPGVPSKIRVGIAIAMGLLIAPIRPTVSPDALLTIIPAEVLLGVVAGFAARLAILGAEAAGQLVGMSIGIGFASFYDPSAGEDSLPTRRIAGALAGLAFLLAGGLEDTLRALAFAPTLPDGAMSTILPHLTDASAHVLVASLRAAAPIVLAALVANVAMALASRAAPALNAFSVMLALFLVVGAGVLLATAPAFARELHAAGALAGGAAEAIFGL